MTKLNPDCLLSCLNEPCCILISCEMIRNSHTIPGPKLNMSTRSAVALNALNVLIIITDLFNVRSASDKRFQKALAQQLHSLPSVWTHSVGSSLVCLSGG